MNIQKLAEVRSLNLAEIGLSGQARNSLASILLGVNSYSLGRDKAKAFTVGQTMDAVERDDDRSGWRSPLPAFYERLLDLGLTHLEWRYLPPRSAAKRLPNLSKEEILNLDVRVLDAFSAKALRDVIPCQKGVGDKCPHRHIYEGFTILAAIQYITYESMVTKRSNNHCFAASFLKAKKMLESLGFGYEDGPMFQVGSTRQYIEGVMTRYEISRQEAAIFVVRVREEGLIQFPVDEG
jgi:hypothetical protein